MNNQTITPRWKKVVQDVLGNKLRTTLVIISIAIGVFAVGTMVGTQILLTDELDRAYMATDPGHAIVFTDPATSGFLYKLGDIEGVTAVDARRHEVALLNLPNGETVRLNLTSRLDFDHMVLHKLTPLAGQWPPQTGEIIIEQASLPYVQAEIGDTVMVETADGQRHPLRIGGTAHDILAEPVVFTEEPNGYISRETMAALGHGVGLDEVLVRVTNDNGVTEQTIETVTDRVQFRLANSGRIPYFVEIFEPDVHPATEDVEPMIWILGILAFLSLFASVFLIINVMTSLLTQQTKQIGVMKSYGATRSDLMKMYGVSVLIYGLLALLVALPLAAIASYQLTRFMADLINFELSGFQLPLPVLLVQAAVALCVPLAAAVFPILRGTSLTIREAIDSQGLNDVTSPLSRLMQTAANLFAYYSQPVQIVLRNVVRRKARLFLTLLTLVLGSAIFISVMSVQASLQGALDDALTYYDFDVGLFFIEAYPEDQISDVLQTMPEAARAESFIRGDAQRIHDGRAGMAFSVIGLAHNPETIRPQIEHGRWLQPGDTNAIVLDALVRNREPDLELGDEILLKIDGLYSEWVIVGFSQSVLNEDGVAYASRDHLAQKIDLVGQATGINVIGPDRSPTGQLTLDQQLREQFGRAGMAIAYSENTADIRDGLRFEFNLIIGMLVVMAALISLVGMIGLSGTMSINVLERTKEIGVLRAIGASNQAIRWIILGEGIVIGVLSWFLGTLLSHPFGRLLTQAIGNEVLESPLNFRFAADWAVYWLLILTIVALVASLWPAQRATRMSIRETLAYVD